MANVVLLHSALGLTTHVLDWADALRSDGHIVLTPDLFDGETYTDVDDGVARVDSSGGPPAFVSTAISHTHSLTGPRVYAGFSLGAAVGEILALTRPEAAGLVLMHGALSPAWIDGALAWPDALRAQLHFMQDDPWIETDENDALLALSGDRCEVFEYPGDGHLFAFEGWHEYDAAAAEAMYEHVTDFLATFD